VFDGYEVVGYVLLGYEPLVPKLELGYDPLVFKLLGYDPLVFKLLGYELVGYVELVLVGYVFDVFKFDG
jgi:hypothetical protein